MKNRRKNAKFNAKNEKIGKCFPIFKIHLQDKTQYPLMEIREGQNLFPLPGKGEAAKTLVVMLSRLELIWCIIKKRADDNSYDVSKIFHI